VQHKINNYFSYANINFEYYDKYIDILVASTNWTVFTFLFFVFCIIRYYIQKNKNILEHSTLRIMSGFSFITLGFSFDRGYWAIKRTLEALDVELITKLLSQDRWGFISIFPRFLAIIGACFVLSPLIRMLQTKKCSIKGRPLFKSILMALGFFSITYFSIFYLSKV
jgi:hypothetical protein